jgi:hypothetical protein
MPRHKRFNDKSRDKSTAPVAEAAIEPAALVEPVTQTELESPSKPETTDTPPSASERHSSASRVCWVVGCLQPAEEDYPFCIAHMDEVPEIRRHTVESGQADREWCRDVRIAAHTLYPYDA